MSIAGWLSTRWFELLQSAGIVAGLAFNSYTLRRDEKARQISNLSAIKQDYIQIWNQLYARPELRRVLDKKVDLKKEPISTAEWLFVKMLIVHLDAVHRAIQTGLFVKLERLQNDIQDFFSAPIPKTVWQELKHLQDQQFARFVESAMH